MTAYSKAKNALIVCVGNQLMMDEGIGSFCYQYMHEHYEIPDNVQLIDAGCMSLSMLPYVEQYDLIITVDALDGTGQTPGTVFQFTPEDMARHCGPEASLHDLKLVDLFDAASLLGYSCEGSCFGMQVKCMEPIEYHIGLTEECAASIPLLAQSVIQKLALHGIVVPQALQEKQQ